MIEYGTVRPGSTIYVYFDSFAGATGASITMTGIATSDILIYKAGSVTQRSSTTGFTLLDTDGIDLDGITGIHGFSIDLSSNADAGFYAAGSDYTIVVSSITIDGQTINFVAAHFRIGHPGAILDTTIATLSSQTSFTLTNGPAENDALKGCVAVLHNVASAVQLGFGLISAYTGSTKTVTLAVGTTFTAAAADNISIMPRTDLSYILGTAVSTPATAGILDVNVKNIDNDAASASGTVTFPNATLASTTNITAGTLTTVTTATNVTTVNGLAANVITAAATAADFGAEIASAVWQDAVAGDFTVASSIGKALYIANIVPGASGGHFISGSNAGTTTFGALTVTGATTLAAVSGSTLTLSGTTSLAAVTTSGTVTFNAFTVTAATTLTGAVSLGSTLGVTGAITATNASNNITLGTFTVTTNAIAWNAAWDAEVQSECADALVAYDGLVPADLPTNFAALLINASGHISRVTLADTLTTYTGNTVQTGDSFAIVNSGTHGNAAIKGFVDDIGVAGAGLTDLGGFSTTAKGQIQTEAEDAIVTHRLDELLNADSDIDGVAPPTVGSVFHELMTKTAGSFTFDQTNDSLEAIRDRGDAAWITATGFSTLTQADVRTAVGLASANLDTQLDAIPTNAELATALGTADDAILAAIAALNNLSSAGAASAVTTALTTALTEGYRGTGATGSVRDLLYEVIAHLGESGIAGTTKTLKKIDGSTTAKTYTLDSATVPTSITETT